jgi:hypothetical protein
MTEGDLRKTAAPMTSKDGKYFVMSVEKKECSVLFFCLDPMASWTCLRASPARFDKSGAQYVVSNLDEIYPKDSHFAVLAEHLTE